MPLDEVIKERLHLLQGYTLDDVLPVPSLRVLVAFEAFSSPLPGYRPPEVLVREREVPGPHGQIPVRVYQPPGDHRPGAGLVLVHGGGFSAGDLDMPEVDCTARELCARAAATVVSVDYRLAQGGVHFPRSPR